MQIFVLKYFGISKLKLLTNNPRKIESLGDIKIEQQGIARCGETLHREVLKYEDAEDVIDQGTGGQDRGG